MNEVTFQFDLNITIRSDYIYVPEEISVSIGQPILADPNLVYPLSPPHLDTSVYAYIGGLDQPPQKLIRKSDDEHIDWRKSGF
jgi:hypothetical protein